MSKKSRTRLIALSVLAAATAAAWHYRDQIVAPIVPTVATARVEMRPFRRSLRRIGTITPMREEHILTKIAGTISQIAEEGKLIEKGAVVLELDATPHRDLKATQEALIAGSIAEHSKEKQEYSKSLNIYREDVNTYNLRVELEQSRLDEIKRGPTPTDEVNARVNVENNKLLLAAMEEELKVMNELAAAGYLSKEELRQKQLDVTEQRLKLVESELAYQKLNRIDEVKVADQDLKVRDAIKSSNAAKERVKLAEANIQRHEERYARISRTLYDRLNVLNENLTKLTYAAPVGGVVVYKRWRRVSPGSEVFDGQELLAIPDLSRMKVNLTVDEAKIGYVSLGQRAEIMPAGWTGQPFTGKVTRIADKGRDEFELMLDDTTAISGTANRQVFDIEVEIEGMATILRPGLRAQIEIALDVIDKALVIPRAAVQRDVEGNAIVRVRHFSGSEVRKIKVLSDDGIWSAVDGVKDGEHVVLHEGGQS